SDTVTVQHCTAADVCLYTWTDRHPKHCNSVTVSGTYYLISTDSNRVACKIYCKIVAEYLYLFRHIIPPPPNGKKHTHTIVYNLCRPFVGFPELLSN